MKISVCIPTYNQAAYLPGCIQSILSQTRLPHEIIVSDDCSTDDTAAMLKKLGEASSLIILLRQPVNLGLTANSNACLKAATGELIVRLGSDDVLLPGYIETLAGLLEKYPEAGYAHSAVNIIDNTGRLSGKRFLYRKNIYETADTGLAATLKGFKVAANILMFRKAALEKVGYLNSRYNFGEDFYLAAVLAAAGFGNVYSSEILAGYRIWDDETNTRQKRKLEEINGLKAVFDEVIIPAFAAKKWNLKETQKAKENFAIEQANSLGWNIYTQQEKAVLQQALLSLSSTFKARLFYNLYKSAFRFVPRLYVSFNKSIKKQLKEILLKT